MRPYYQDSAVTIYHGDCREILPLLEPVDLVLTDPPYGFEHYESDKTPDIFLFSHIRRAAVFGYPETLFDWCGVLGKPSGWIVWWPTNGALRGGFHHSALQRETEHIALFGNLLGEARMPKSDRALDPKKWQMLNDRKASDVWRDPSPGQCFNSHLRLHPNEKPLRLMDRLTRLMGGTGTILDPFMGSGTTLRAAKDLGRKAIGIEIEERYCEIAAKRMSQEVLQFAATGD